MSINIILTSIVTILASIEQVNTLLVIYVHISLYLGPSLPENIHGASLLTSPTGKSVILIGGCSSRINASKQLYELSGNSTLNLKWRVMDQALVYPRSSHLTHYLDYEDAQEYSTLGEAKYPSKSQQSIYLLFKKCLNCIGEKFTANDEICRLFSVFCFLAFGLFMYSELFQPHWMGLYHKGPWFVSTFVIGNILFFPFLFLHAFTCFFMSIDN